MVTLGTDSHKATHTFVATDETGRELGQGTFSTGTEGYLKALRWSAKWPERCWALEDCRHLSRRLERDLLGAGERVVRVPPKLMAGARLCRQHNDANVLSMGERVISEEMALAIVRVWLTTSFEGGRHAQRIAQLEP